MSLWKYTLLTVKESSLSQTDCIYPGRMSWLCGRHLSDFSSNFFFESWLGCFDSLCIFSMLPCCPAQREHCKKASEKRRTSWPKQLAFGRAQVRWNGTIELDKNPLRAKSESGAIRMIMGGNFVNFCVSLFARSGAGCGSL